MVHVSNVTKSYANHEAIHEVSFHIPEGGVFGILGNPGSGKTSLAHMISGYLAYPSGSIRICGIELSSHPSLAKRHIGYLPENAPLYLGMTIREYLVFLYQFHRLPKKERESRIGQVISALELAQYVETPIFLLSLSLRKLAGLAGALIANPDILLLDEPTANLDSNASLTFRQIIARLAELRTVVLFSDSTAEIMSLCKHVVVLNEGKVAADDSIENLRTLAGDINRLKVKIKGNALQVRSAFFKLENTLEIDFLPSRDGEFVEIVFECYSNYDIRPQIWQICHTVDLPILEMRYINITLEDIFLQLTGKLQGGR